LSVRFINRGECILHGWLVRAEWTGGRCANELMADASWFEKAGWWVDSFGCVWMDGWMDGLGLCSGFDVWIIALYL
jgi:hypothetical protein